MIRMLFKLFKFSLIIYLMICFKNLYSETFSDNNVVTVGGPNIIDINDLDELENTNDRVYDEEANQQTIFAEKLQHYSHNNQVKLKEKEKRLEEARKHIVTAEKYRELLEDGVEPGGLAIPVPKDSLNQS